MSVLYPLLSLCCALAFYLATAHQRLRPAWQGHARGLRRLGWLLAVLALAAASTALGPWAGLFAALSAFMLSAVLLPYLDAWWWMRRERAHVG